MAPRILKPRYISLKILYLFTLAPKIFWLFIFPPKEILGGSLLIVSPMGQGKELQFSSRAHDGRVNNILLY